MADRGDISKAQVLKEDTAKESGSQNSKSGSKSLHDVASSKFAAIDGSASDSHAQSKTALDALAALIPPCAVDPTSTDHNDPVEAGADHAYIEELQAELGVGDKFVRQMYETFLKQHKDDLDIQNCKLTFARYVEGVKVIQDSKVKKDADGQNDGENA